MSLPGGDSSHSYIYQAPSTTLRNTASSTSSLHLSPSYATYLLSPLSSLHFDKPGSMGATSPTSHKSLSRDSQGGGSVDSGRDTYATKQHTPEQDDSTSISPSLSNNDRGSSEAISQRLSQLSLEHERNSMTTNGRLFSAERYSEQQQQQQHQQPPQTSSNETDHRASLTSSSSFLATSPLQGRPNVSPLAAIQTARGVNRPLHYHFDSAPSATRGNQPGSSNAASSENPIYSSNSTSAAAIIGGSISGTDVHARLLDFQKSRQSRSRSNSAGTGGAGNQMLSGSLMSSRLPSQSSIANASDDGSVQPGGFNTPSNTTTANANANTSSSNASGGSSPASPTPFSSLALTPAPIKKVSSLSQRRGMKLNISQVSSPSMSLNEGTTEPNSETEGDEERASFQINSDNITSSGESSTSSSSSIADIHIQNNANSKDDISPLPGKAMGRTGSIRRNRPGTLSSAIGGAGTPTMPGPGNKGLFDNYQKYVDVKTGSLNFRGKASLHANGIDFSSGSSFRISIDEFEPLGELGRGNYGTVTKVLHRPTNVIMAMKEIRLELDEQKFTQIIMELEVLHSCVSPYIVDFYGAFFVEGAVYVCMEYMDGGSLDKIYQGGIDEPYLRIITDAAVRGLKQLKEEHNIIHRDVKPTNILVSTSGKVKLCDFGVSGNLVASIARTNIGCQSYMAPERIRSFNPNQAMTYTVESDVWSLALSIVETALGSYPYPPETYENIFSQLSAIVDGVPPSLPPDKFSPEAIDFVEACLHKNARRRPTYAQLLKHPWLSDIPKDQQNVDLGAYIAAKLKNKASNLPEENEPTVKPKPALHTARPTDVAASGKI